MPQPLLAPYACHPEFSRGRRFAEDLEDAPALFQRAPFQRDRDRIVHSTAFRRLEYKTQVFVNHEGDHYRTRLTHSLEVAQVARAVARSLRLHEDLAETIALAHDLGHPPFGHAGEEALNACMAPYGGFNHNDQSCRVLTFLEQRYARFDGLNLTWESLSGLVKHNGPILDTTGLPHIAAVDADWDLRLNDYASLEAQVAALADDIAYHTHDLDDGIRAGFFSLEELAATFPIIAAVVAEVDAAYPALTASSPRRQHEVLRRLMRLVIHDLLAASGQRLADAAPQNSQAVASAGQPLIAFSPEIQAYYQTLRGWLMIRMYRHSTVNRMTAKARRVVRALFEQFMNDTGLLPERWRDKLKGLDEPAIARQIADYIAGMTDRYALEEYRKLVD
jgi:dGTPase